MYSMIYSAVCLILGLILMPVPALANEVATREPSPSAADRAIAFGLLLDTPRPPAVVDQSLIIAEQLRRIYGIDTGNRFADFRAAAERARDEVLEPLAPNAKELAAAAESLGYSLVPERCKNYCDNVERLARVEVARRALWDFIAAAGNNAEP